MIGRSKLSVELRFNHNSIYPSLLGSVMQIGSFGITKTSVLYIQANRERDSDNEDKQWRQVDRSVFRDELYFHGERRLITLPSNRGVSHSG